MERNFPSLGTLREACGQNQQAEALAWNLSGDKKKEKRKPNQTPNKQRNDHKKPPNSTKENK